MAVWFDPNDYMLGEYQEIEPPVRSCIKGLDAMLGGGWSPGMWSIMAAPGTGKSAFGLYAAFMSAWNGTPCAYLSIEMDAAHCWHRIASAFSSLFIADEYGIEPFQWSDVPRMSLETQRSMEAEHVGIADMLERDMFCKATVAITRRPVPGTGKPLQLHITSGGGINELPTLMDTMDEAAAMGCKLIVVDYLQLISSMSNASAYEKATEVSHAISEKAKELRVAVLVICAMNRESMKGQAQPTMHDGSGTAAIEYDSTGVISLRTLDEGGTADTRRIEARVHKNRAGRSGDSILFDYKPAYNTFQEVRNDQ